MARPLPRPRGALGHESIVRGLQSLSGLSAHLFPLRTCSLKKSPPARKPRGSPAYASARARPCVHLLHPSRLLASPRDGRTQRTIARPSATPTAASARSCSRYSQFSSNSPVKVVAANPLATTATQLKTHQGATPPVYCEIVIAKAAARRTGKNSSIFSSLTTRSTGESQETPKRNKGGPSAGPGP